jgi:hypothetical protein
MILTTDLEGGLMADPKISMFTAEQVATDKDTLRRLITTMAEGAWADFKTTNEATAGKVMKAAAGVAAGSTVATELGAVTPLRWVLSGFGPLPLEFTKSGAIQVFQYTTLQRALIVAKAAAAKFVIVTVAYETGVMVGCVINQTLSEKTKDAIGGTINEIVNEGGWKLLFEHPFGIGM